MEGVVKEWNPIDCFGTIESDGKSYIVKRQNIKRGTLLKVGDAVRFIPVNLLEGPTAQNVTVISSK
jgi:cold shock CspA family protein